MTTRKYTHEEIIANKDIKVRLAMIMHNQKIEQAEREEEQRKARLNVMCDRPLTKEDYIKELKDRLFLIEMIDHWTNEDKAIMREIEIELARVEK